MREYGQFCALARALDRIGHRWTLLVVRELLIGPKRFTDLRDGLPGIASNLLADRLRDLQADGLVVQRQLPPPAASTVYELTVVGEELRGVVEGLIRWGGRWMVSGVGEDVFRGDWLALALSALRTGSAVAQPLYVRVSTGDDAVDGIDLLIEGGSVTVASPPGEPDLVVRGDPATILGLAAGAISPTAAVGALDLDPPGDEGARLLRMALRPGAPGPVG